MTFFEQLDCKGSDKCIFFTPSKWATKYTLYAFKISENQIRPGIYDPQYVFYVINARGVILLSKKTASR